MCLCVCTHTPMCICLSINLCTNRAINLSIYQSTYQSIRLSIYLHTHARTHAYQICLESRHQCTRPNKDACLHEGLLALMLEGLILENALVQTSTHSRLSALPFLVRLSLSFVCRPVVSLTLVLQHVQVLVCLIFTICLDATLRSPDRARVAAAEAPESSAFKVRH